MRLPTYEHLEKYIHLLEVDLEKGEILNRRPNENRGGYLSVAIKGKRITTHNIISFLKFGEKSIGLEVNHINGIKTDNSPENLELVTRSENMKHAFKVGLKDNKKGEGSPSAKLTDKQVLEIHELLKTGMYLREIAAKFNVNRATISLIKSGKNWSHLKNKG